MAESSVVITPEALREHWQGHRKLTRKMIDAFPEKDLFNFRIDGMRPFSELVLEFIGMAGPTLVGVVTKEWPNNEAPAKPQTKADLLKRWDESTEQIEKLWPQIPEGRFQEVDKAFGQWEMPVHGLLLYIIDNEVHHRGQGYVYLRALGIEPPAFWDRS